MAHDVARIIYDIAVQSHRKEVQEKTCIIEVVHNIFELHACAQWIKIHRELPTEQDDLGDIVVTFKGIQLRFPNMREFIKVGADLVMRTMLHDFMDFAETTEMTDMDYITINVHHGRQRVSVIHSYVGEHIHRDLVCARQNESREVEKLMGDFSRQLNFVAHFSL